MPRKARGYLLVPDAIVHAYNWSVDSRPIFRQGDAYDFFLDSLLHALEKFPVSVLVYTLVPNRFDLILHQHEPYAIAAFMKYVEEEFAGWYNQKLRRNGPVFSGRYRGEIILDEHELLRVSRDIHICPVVSGLASDDMGWKYSSRSDYKKGTNGKLADTSLILALAGGADQYTSFMDRFDSARPDSTELFLCTDHADIWMGKAIERTIL